MCVSNCPYKKAYFNWHSGKAEKCTLCYPRIEAGMPTVCSETCVGRIRYIGVVLYDADRVEEAASVADEKDLLDAQLSVFLDPEDPEVRRQAEADGILAGLLVEMQPTKAAQEAARLTGLPRRDLYQRALEMKGK